MDVSKNFGPIHDQTSEASIEQKTRLKLKENTNLSAALYEIKVGDLATQFKNKKSYLVNYTIEIQEGNERILVNMNKLIKRLHIKPEAILEADEQGELTSFLKQKALSLSSYKSMKGKFNKRDIRDLLPLIQSLVKDNQNNYQAVQIQDHIYQLGFDKDNKKIELLFFEKVFASGLFGKVWQVKNVLDDTQEAFKEARLEIPGAREDIENTYQLLSLLHSQGKVWGIQPPPKRIAHLKIDGENTAFGYFAMKYDTDYFEDNQRSCVFEERLSDFHQLLGGLKQMHDQNIIHRDLKTENIFVQYKGDHKVVNIADFGGAYETQKILTESFFNRIHTPQYTLLEELELANDLVGVGLDSDVPEEQEEVKNIVTAIEKAGDVFSMGCILYIVLSGELPFYFDEDSNYPMRSNSYRPLKDAPPALDKLVRDMLVLDYRKRPAIEEVFEEYEIFLEKNYPKILKEIQQRITEEYPASSAKL